MSRIEDLLKGSAPDDFVPQSRVEQILSGDMTTVPQSRVEELLISDGVISGSELDKINGEVI